LKRQQWVIIGLLAAGWIIILNQPNALSSRLRAVFVNIGTSFLKMGEVIPSFRSRRALTEDNQNLRAENDRLQRQLAQNAELMRENQALRRMLRLAEQNTGQRVVGARVIGRDTSNWWKTVQIDSGTQQGVREDQPVINADGLVGRVISVTRGESRVLLLVDPNCRVSGLLQDTRAPGIVVGAHSAFAVNPVCRMTFIERAARVAPGQLVVTSGLGGVFPKGLPIGTVAGTRLNEQTGMYLDVDVKPAVDFHRLEEVMVIVNP
jgi:rod shape-determining protein MreC